MSSRAWRISAESPVSPGQHQQRTRDPVPGDRHPHDDLRQVRAGVLALAQAAEPGFVSRLTAGRRAAAVLIPGQHLIGMPGLQNTWRSCRKKQISLEVQQAGQVVVHLLAEVGFHRVQLVHRPVAGVVAELGKAVDVHVARHPPGGGQLAGGRQRPAGHQREQGALRTALRQMTRQQNTTH
jgi:hypothetical protein